MEDGRLLAQEVYKIACRIEQKELQLSALELRGRDKISEDIHSSELDYLGEIANLKQVFFELIDKIPSPDFDKTSSVPYAAV